MAITSLIDKKPSNQHKVTEHDHVDTRMRDKNIEPNSFSRHTNKRRVKPTGLVFEFLIRNKTNSIFR